MVLYTSVGTSALQNNTTASNNTAVGYQALYTNTGGNGTTAASNTAVGYQNLYLNTTGYGTSSYGIRAGYNNTTGALNVFIGYEAGYLTTTGSNNTFLGTSAGYAVSTGTKNTIIGQYNGNQGGLDIRTSSNNIVLSDGDGNPRGIFQSDNFLMGTVTTSYGSISAKFTSASPTSGSAGLFYTGFTGDVSTSALNIGKFDNNNTTSQIFVKFGINNAGTGSGQINANGGGAAAFGSFSDRRLKENIIDLPPQLDKIMALRTVEFDYIESEGGGHQIGFIAQEVKEVYPDLVGEREDGMLTLTDFNKNDARLIKAIQELKTIVDTQAAEIAELKAKVGI